MTYVTELRVALTVADFDEAVAFYRDALGLPESESYEGEDDARVVILSAGIATLELSNPAQVRLIDRVEATMIERNLALPGENVLITMAVPVGSGMQTNVLKIHQIQH